MEIVQYSNLKKNYYKNEFLGKYQKFEWNFGYLKKVYYDITLHFIILSE